MIMSKEELRRAEQNRRMVGLTKHKPKDLIYRGYKEPRPRPRGPGRPRKIVQKPAESVFDSLRRRLKEAVNENHT
jgi:hypothetical protein